MSIKENLTTLNKKLFLKEALDSSLRKDKFMNMCFSCIPFARNSLFWFLFIALKKTYQHRWRQRKTLMERERLLCTIEMNFCFKLFLKFYAKFAFFVTFLLSHFCNKKFKWWSVISSSCLHKIASLHLKYIMRRHVSNKIICRLLFFVFFTANETIFAFTK